MGKSSRIWFERDRHSLGENNLGDNNIFAPVDLEAYLQKIKRVLRRRLPEQCYCLFECCEHSFFFELVISPILPVEGEPTTVLIMGHLLEKKEMFSFSYTDAPVAIYSYQKLLDEIIRNIRRSLNLNNIWQQTVINIGETFAVSRCLILTERYQRQELVVEAEYCRAEFSSACEHQLTAKTNLISNKH